MQKEEQAALIKVLLIGEILIAISSVASIGLFVPGMIFISMLSVFGLAMTIFASIRLTAAAKEFKLSFIAAIIALLLALVADILLITGVRMLDYGIVKAALVFSAIEMLVSIYVVFQILKGCRVLISQVDQHDKFGYRTTIIYGAIAAIAIALNIATAFITDERTVQILSSVLVGVNVAAAITYVVALIRTHNYLS